MGFPLSETPLIEIIAGPNGSGKTTFAEAYVTRLRKKSIFLNPDIIASGLGPQSEKASFAAGRILISEVKSKINSKESFSFESTLSGKTWLPILKEAKLSGYQIVIYFLALNSPQANVARVQKRVRQGGHNIPTKTILRRHPRSFKNFWVLYRPLCSYWFVFNNSGKKPTLVEKKEAFEKRSNETKEKFEKSFLKGKLK